MRLVHKTDHDAGALASDAGAASRIDGRPPGFPTVSAIIPAYNGADILDIAIASALAQTHHLLEVIVVDDGSTDGTAEVASRYPVTVIRQRNSGPSSARNSGATQASGEWLAFLDHDDRWRCDKTELQLKSATPTTGVVFCSTFIPYAILPELYPTKTGERVTFDQLWRYNIVGSPSGALVRKAAFDEVRGFDLSPELICVEDYNLWLRMALAKWEMVSGPRDLYRYTPALSSLTSQTLRMGRAELFNIERVGDVANISRADIDERKRFSLFEYARHFIARGDRAGARQQLRQLPLDSSTLRLWCRTFIPK